MHHRKSVRYLAFTFGIIMIAWLILTIYVELAGPPMVWTEGNPHSDQTALIVFDPDPFNNLDEEVCLSFARALAESNFHVTIMTASKAQKSSGISYDLYVYCANTYNWLPDRAILQFVQLNRKAHKNKPVVAITLGAGSTGHSQAYFEKQIKTSGGVIQSSHTLWLWRPNDETRPEESNKTIAIGKAYEWGLMAAHERM